MGMEIKNFQTFLYYQYTLENPTQVFKATVFKYGLLHGGNHEPFLPRHMGHLQNNPLPVTTISQGTAQKFGQTKNLKQIEQKLQTIKSPEFQDPCTTLASRMFRGNWLTYHLFEGASSLTIFDPVDTC